MTPFEIRTQISHVEGLVKKHNFVLLFDGYMGQRPEHIHIYNAPQFCTPRDFPLVSFPSWELAEQWLVGYDMATILNQKYVENFEQK